MENVEFVQAFSKDEELCYEMNQDWRLSGLIWCLVYNEYYIFTISL